MTQARVDAVFVNPLWNFVIQLVLGQLRHYATAIFTIMATRGFITNNDIDAAVGSVMVLATMAFSAYDKWKHQGSTGTQVFVHPVSVPVDTPATVAETSAVPTVEANPPQHF